MLDSLEVSLERVRARGGRGRQGDREHRRRDRQQLQPRDGRRAADVQRRAGRAGRRSRSRSSTPSTAASTAASSSRAFAPGRPARRSTAAWASGSAAWRSARACTTTSCSATSRSATSRSGVPGYTNAVSYSHLDLAARYFASLDLAITDNLLLALSAGVDFGSLPSRPADEAAAAKRDAALGPAIHLGATRVRDNLILGCRTVGRRDPRHQRRRPQQRLHLVGVRHVGGRNRRSARRPGRRRCCAGATVSRSRATYSTSSGSGLPSHRATCA